MAALNLENYHLVTTAEGSIVWSGENLVVMHTDEEGQQVYSEIANEPAVRAYFNIMEAPVENGNGSSAAPIPSCSKSAPSHQNASWKDDNAVIALIYSWKDHGPKFQSSALKNNEMWTMISVKLREMNPAWNYTGVQCNSKFKEIRKIYTRTRDNNLKKSGEPIETCKYYEELEDVLGNKPIVKPVAVASSSKKHKRDEKTSENGSEENEVEEEEEEGNLNQRKKKEPKKSRISLELEKWALNQKQEREKRDKVKAVRHEERMAKLDAAIKSYESKMDQLFDKI